MTHSFSFDASYVEGYQVQITAPDWNIDETSKLEEALAEQLVALGIYDEQGNVTEYGKSWEISQLQGKSVAYVQDKGGNARLYYEAQVEAGYSEYTLGYGFRFVYLIDDAGYELENVVFIECVE